MISDANKGISAITYNYLNLPTKVSFGTNRFIDYIYDASGVKQQKVVTEGSSLTTTQYAGNYIYENNNLQFFNHAEGYVEPVIASGSAAISSFNYVYQYKDHLGNIRLSYTDADGNGTIKQDEIIEENNYYPFGLKHKGYNFNTSSLGNSVAQRYKFGGKEYDESFDGTLNTYDFGARNYDPAIGRWMNIDPLAELMMTYSPYNYAFNNPIYYIDSDGMSPYNSVIKSDYYRDKNNNVWYDSNVFGPSDVPNGGTYMGPTYYDEINGTFWDVNGDPHTRVQALNEVVVTGTSSSAFTIYGIGTDTSVEKSSGFTTHGAGTDTSGREGITTHGIGYDDFTPLGGGGKSSSVLAQILRFISGLFSTVNNVNKVFEPNVSTMENIEKEESKKTPGNVKVVLKHYLKSFHKKDGMGNVFHKIDSIVRDTVEIKTFNIEKTKDSVRNQNANRKRRVREW